MATATATATESVIERAIRADENAADLKQILSLNKWVAQAHQEWERSHLATKARKEELEEAQAALSDYISGIDAVYPLFDKTEAAVSAAQAAPSADSWRDTPVADLGLADDLVEALVLNNADTAGKVVRAVASGLIGDFQGVEDDDLAEIRSALDRFWHRLSKAQAESYEAFVAGIAPAPEPTAKAAPKRRRKVAS